MFTRKTSLVLIGILFLSSVYLMGQEGWEPDPCADIVCEENGTCVEGLCECDAGYEGDSCETNIDDCDPDPCLNGGICTDGVDSYSCECVDGYTGGNCDMAPIPAGCFDMGDTFAEGFSWELPVHEVCVSAFEMDIHEITNAEYAECVDDGRCIAPYYTHSYSRATYYGDPTYDDFPVTYVNWFRVGEYCTWAGKRLPTEAEWEYAARGGLSGKRYPWGDTISSTDANYGSNIGDTTMVESYAPNGYGLYDMGGNVWEWVEDDLHLNYNLAPTDGSAWVDIPRDRNRVLRGGSWLNVSASLRVASRLGSYLGLGPASEFAGFGGRCAR